MFDYLKSGFIKVEIKGKVAIISIDHPPVNAISIDMLCDLFKAFEWIPDDKSIRVIVLNAIGKHFSAGADINTFRQLPLGGNTPYGNAIMNQIERCPLPVIACIHGACLGGGMEMTLACDIRVAAESSQLGLVEGTLGLAPNYGGCTRLPWLIGEGNAKMLLFTAERFSAQRGKELGIIQEVYPDDELMERTMELANRIAKNAPLSAMVNKKVILHSRNSVIAPGLIEEEWAARYLARSEDKDEGWRARKEKRDPEFQNK